MNICGIRRRSLRSITLAAASLFVVAIVGVLGLFGCGSGSNPYNPVVKPNPATFTIAVTPGSVSVPQGNTANYTVNITYVNGFTSPVTLSASGLPAGATATFGEVTATATGETATLAISTSTTVEAESAIVVGQSKLAKPTAGVTSSRLATPLGSTNFTVTGVGNGVTQSAAATLVVTTAPSFTVTLAPATAGANSIPPGGTANYIVTVTSIGGFSSPVNLTLGGVPQPSTSTFGSTTVTPTAAGATTTLSILTVFNEGTATLPGLYTLTVTGTSGSLSNSGSSAFNVGAFSISVTEASEGSGTIFQGGTAHYNVTVTALDGFAPVVTLVGPALPTGAKFTLGKTTLTPTAAGVTTSLTITTTSSTPTGSVDFTVSGSGGGWNTAGSAQLTVNTPPAD